MSNHTVCFYGEIRKIIPELSPNTPLTIPLGHSLPNADSRRSVSVSGERMCTILVNRLED